MHTQYLLRTWYRKTEEASPEAIRQTYSTKKATVTEWAVMWNQLKNLYPNGAVRLYECKGETKKLLAEAEKSADGMSGDPKDITL